MLGFGWFGGTSISYDHAAILMVLLYIESDSTLLYMKWLCTLRRDYLSIFNSPICHCEGRKLLRGPVFGPLAKCHTGDEYVTESVLFYIPQPLSFRADEFSGDGRW